MSRLEAREAGEAGGDGGDGGDGEKCRNATCRVSKGIGLGVWGGIIIKENAA